MSIEIRFGNPEEYDDLIDFLNYVFGFNGTQNCFTKLIPQAYARESHPEKNNLLAVEDGRLRAAVGMLPYRVSVCGESLSCVGIGNVAVHPFHRGNGYMKTLMNEAMERMKANGTHMAVLGGHRHRYRYFSYDKIGSVAVFRIAEQTVRHGFKTHKPSTLALQELCDNNDPMMDLVAEDVKKGLYHAIRQRETLLRHMTGHFCRLYAVTENGAYRGYALMDNDHLKEFRIAPDRLEELLIALWDGLRLHSLTVRIPLWQTDFVLRMLPLFESYCVEPVRAVSILRFQEVISGFFKLKAATEALPNGTLALRILGVAGEECLRMTVENGACSVETCKPEDCSLTLSHLDAMHLLFSPVWPARNALPPHARLWLPLPFWVDPCEHF
ncbi:MAG: GNAT family N-acetyltransferase [Ruminococcaceae bacterium]|nr:GNAT family N-acetyltransferase [Oscillospiraceae bacterium]